MTKKEIDKDFVEIIDYLNKMGFKTFSSCDGVLANHKKKEEVDLAYVAFLKSPKIIELMTVFLRDKEHFQIMISNNSQAEPYYYLDNLIQGNVYNVGFSNKNGELTAYFEKIIRSLSEEKIKVSEQED